MSYCVYGEFLISKEGLRAGMFWLLSLLKINITARDTVQSALQFSRQNISWSNWKCKMCNSSKRKCQSGNHTRILSRYITAFRLWRCKLSTVTNFLRQIFCDICWTFSDVLNRPLRAHTFCHNKNYSEGLFTQSMSHRNKRAVVRWTKMSGLYDVTTPANTCMQSKPVDNNPVHSLQSSICQQHRETAASYFIVSHDTHMRLSIQK